MSSIDLWTGAAALAGLLALLWIGWTLLANRDDLRTILEREVRITELRGRITYLDQSLSMTARMAAATGDPQWRDRFAEAEPELDAAIAEASRLASPETRASLATTTIEAHRDLMQMSRHALELVAQGQLKEAQSFLASPEFAYLEDVSATGMEMFGQDLKGRAETYAKRAAADRWFRTTAFGITAVLLVIVLMAAQYRGRLRQAAARDVLTQLPNRSRFFADLSVLLAERHGTADKRRALVIIGLDRFKLVNDTHDHVAADRLLQLVAARLRKAVGTDTPLGRVGGDEFAFVVEGRAGERALPHALDMVFKVLGEAYRLSDAVEISLGHSAGLVWIPLGSTSVEDVFRHAQMALNRCKADGRGQVKVFDQTMEDDLRSQARLESDLRQAIEREEIVPFFQPLVDLRTARIVGVEVLARWPHRERGWVSPAEFIPLAESLGLIAPLSRLLLRQSCRAAAPWPAHITVAFNVSPLQLQDKNLPGEIELILAETGFPASRLEIEVTESALVSDLDLARSLLEDLRELGVRLALDDFGTGYSSLKHLRSLPFDKLKIDASFVGGMRDDEESGKIVTAVIGLGHSLGLLTVAEGVETADVATLLRALGCDIGQGWLFGRPVPAGELAFGPDDNVVAALVA